ncbi:branched-chain amino acid transport system II carrier protein [Corynebacterium gerontici]|uniref:Branched-chain amino acid transport system 2 carrier protein n=1 Tax=Corynebacterium gerontici TaxID=2079234 RepID=A0A3G6J797_9CORY|nr:branched-chain amino acid transport system II carrier protein [Corynebacterium gerontici]AZA11904.1 Branched-chain amino acid transport system 2 carrier protein [Corynebacterium gerontici]
MRKPAGVIIPTALTLFSMFFGAGNLIFPPMLGQLAGDHFAPAMIGFLLGGIGLPVLTVITMAMTGADVRSLGARAGNIFNIAFCVVAYLAVGAMYAIPRTGAVSYSAVVDPVLQPVDGANAVVAHAGFNALFFAVALLLAVHPEGIVSALGKVLTPILLVLLVLLVGMVLWWFGDTPVAAAQAPYENSPLTAGFLEGYLTMDSIAALAFGILVVSALRTRAATSVLKPAIAVSLIAGGLLGAIYVGLGLIGLHFDGRFDDGAVLLAQSAHEVFGPWGQLVFGLTVLLACMTTAVGLLAATSEFFHRLIPGVSYRSWLITFTLVSFAIASLGLSTMLSIAAPLISFIYPIAITLVIATIAGRIFNACVRGSHDPTLWSFRFAAWTAAACSAFAALETLGVPGVSIQWLPLAQQQLTWVAPAIVAYAVGLVIDGVRYRKELGEHRAL